MTSSPNNKPDSTDSAPAEKSATKSTRPSHAEAADKFQQVAMERWRQAANESLREESLLLLDQVAPKLAEARADDELRKKLAKPLPHQIHCGR